MIETNKKPTIMNCKFTDFIRVPVTDTELGYYGFFADMEIGDCARKITKADIGKSVAMIADLRGNPNDIYCDDAGVKLECVDKMTKSLRVRYMAIVSCGQCPECEFDDIDKVFRCRRSTMEKKVDPYKVLPDWCFLLTAEDIGSRTDEYVDSDLTLQEAEYQVLAESRKM